MDVLILNGPNLNLLGTREPGIYGNTSFFDHCDELRERYKGQVTINYFQSNAEHLLIDKIHQNTDPIIFNPAAFTHTSVALRDALLATKANFVEVHISNVYAREAFRHHSYFSDIASAVIVGAGLLGYELALQHFLLKR